MTLRKDTVAGENLAALLVILGMVFIIGSLVIAMMSPIFQSGTDEQTGVEPLAVFGDTSIGAYWTPDTGHAVTWANVTDDPIRASGDMEFSFTLAAATIYVDDIRNNTYYYTSDWWGKYYDFVRFLYGSSNIGTSYYAIENATEYNDDGTVYAILYPGWPLNETTAFIVEFEDDSNSTEVNEALWADNAFTIYIAWVTTPSEGAELAWYNIAFQIATFQYEITGTAFDDIFSAVFDMLILTAAIVVFSRIFHGG